MRGTDYLKKGHPILNSFRGARKRGGLPAVLWPFQAEVPLSAGKSNDG